MAVKTIDLSPERKIWADAEYGEEVRGAGISSLQKTEDVINSTVDEVNRAAVDVQNAAKNTEKLNQKSNEVLNRANETVDHANDILDEAAQRAGEIFESAKQQVSISAGNATLSESWAVGGTDVRDGENTNNAMYYSQQSETQADRAKTEADRAARYSQIIAPGFYFDPAEAKLYMKAGVGVDFMVQDARLYWKVAV